jgi:hypothetical protein
MVPEVEEGCVWIEAPRLMPEKEKIGRGRGTRAFPSGFTMENQSRQTPTNRGIRKTNH